MKQDRYEQAKKRVEEIKRFYVHLVVYVLVNLGLFAINMIASPGHVWFFWPALGWGIAVAIHAATLIIEGRHVRGAEDPRARRAGRARCSAAAASPLLDTRVMP